MVQKRSASKEKKKKKAQQTGQIPPVQEEQPVQQPQQPQQDRKPRKALKRRKRRIWLPIAISVIIVCVLGSCVVIAWDRWMRYDDAVDFQGQWVDAKTQLPISIDAKQINLSSKVAYPYTLNTWDKTIIYNFSQLNGSAMYLFSPDRNTLYIVEGEQRDIVADTLRLVDLVDLPDYVSNTSATILVREPIATNTDAVATVQETPSTETASSEPEDTMLTPQDKSSE